MHQKQRRAYRLKVRTSIETVCSHGESVNRLVRLDEQLSLARNRSSNRSEGPHLVRQWGQARAILKDSVRRNRAIDSDGENGKAAQFEFFTRNLHKLGFPLGNPSTVVPATTKELVTEGPAAAANDKTAAANIPVESAANCCLKRRPSIE